jgi:hypothetical protein
VSWLRPRLQTISGSPAERFTPNSQRLHYTSSQSKRWRFLFERFFGRGGLSNAMAFGEPELEPFLFGEAFVHASKS